MPFLKGIDVLRNIEFDRTYTWDIRFPSAPAPFNEFIPAISVTEEMSDVVSKSFEAAMDSFEVPRGADVNKLTITYVDGGKSNDPTSGMVFTKWLEEWMTSTILNHGKYVATLETAVKTLQIIKFTSQHEIVSDTVYQVYPSGKLVYNGTSEDGFMQYSISFTIAG